MEDVDPEKIVRGLVVVSSRLTRAFRRLIGNESELVTLRALAVVEQYQPVRVGHFAQGYLSSQPAATKLLGRLESEGLVVREASDTDRRASQFSITEAGRARLAKNRQIMTDQMVPYFESLTAEERMSVYRALELVGDYLRNEHPVGTDDADETDDVDDTVAADRAAASAGEPDPAAASADKGDPGSASAGEEKG